ncbi:hypothetical protein SRABI106_00519 [Rahnella aquatilis]|nr:hypothetical protein SRABI106_00519 [Rahnella aquatilis]
MQKGLWDNLSKWLMYCDNVTDCRVIPLIFRRIKGFTQTLIPFRVLVRTGIFQLSGISPFNHAEILSRLNA